MLGYSTALYDDTDNKWQFYRVNDLFATCYIKYSTNHYSYIQSLANHKEDNFLNKEKDEFNFQRSNVYSSPEILSGIHQNLIPLYSLVMIKDNSKVELLATNNRITHEYHMKTVSFPKLPILQSYKVITKSPMKLPSVIDSFTTPFSFKTISDKIKFQTILTELYEFLTIEELFNMTINKQNYAEVKQSTFIVVCSFC